MKGISTVGILILTVFLSISVLPACADPADPILPRHPVIVFGYADGELVDGNATVTICAAKDASKNITVPVGESYGAIGWWMAEISTLDVDHGDLIRVMVTAANGSITEDTTHIVDTSSPGGMAIPRTSGGGGRGGGGGTYPPGWGETPTPAPTPDATVAPASTDTTEPSGTPLDKDDAVTSAAEDEALTKETETTEMQTKGTPGFEAVCMIAGLLAAMYLVLRRRE